MGVNHKALIANTKTDCLGFIPIPKGRIFLVGFFGVEFHNFVFFWVQR